MWGWIYSGDYQFVQKSAPNYSDRNLDTQLRLTFGQTQILSMAVAAKGFDEGVYYIGTGYAHRLYQAVIDGVNANKFSKMDGRHLLAKAILKALPKLQTEFTALSQTQFLDPNRPLQLIQAEAPDLNINLQ